MPNSFQEVLTAAVADLTENGFDSAERIAMWSVRLRDAARESLIPEREMERMLRERLADAYTRMLDRGGLEKVNKGVERFTIERIKPSLRAELDRRILASASLIRLNRDAAIEKTIQRFQGWATSIPKGGSGAVAKRETKDDIRKSLGQLPFEERRVLIDQGHKLTSSISEILAKDGNAIAGVWHSHWRQSGYDYRVDHKERDDKIYAVRDNWAIQAGLMKVGRAGYTDDITKPGEEVFCRCYYSYLHHLRDLPTAMLTAKGRAQLERVRQGAAA